MTISGASDGTSHLPPSERRRRTAPRLQRTPEVYGGAECFGREASAYTKRRLPPGTAVAYELGAERTDRYERALAYLRVGGPMVNDELLERGYATPLAIEPNTRYEERFNRLAADAAAARRGLWGACPRP